MTAHLPDSLRPDPTRRGPIGTEAMGVSIALPISELTYDDGTVWDQADWENAVAHYQPQLLAMLKHHVGGARPQTEPQVFVDGPHSDPLQGLLYVMTCSAWFIPAALSVDCTAYKARSTRAVP